MDETNKKRIEVVEMRVGDIKFGFGNPRKIKKANERHFRTSGGAFFVPQKYNKSW